MKNLLSYKVKLYTKIGAILLLSIIMLAVVNANVLDTYIYTDYNSTIVIFVLVCIVGLINGYVFSVFSDSVMEKPQLFYSMMSSLTTQLFLFAVLYFFIDAVFDNSYALMPYNLQGQNLILNVAIICLLAVAPSIKAKKLKVDAKTLISLVVLAAVIYQMNYLELVFYGAFFGIIFLSKRIKCEKAIWFLTRHKIIGIIALVIMVISVIVYVSLSTQNAAFRCVYFALPLLLCWIIYNSINLLRRNMS